MKLFTIGYEGATMDEFIAALLEAKVERVIDVRALPLSRRPGFSKTPLRNALAEAGIDYVHLRALGTPADGRAAARAGRQADLERIYASQLELPEAMVAAEQMKELAAEKPSALLCFEREPKGCHRRLILDWLWAMRRRFTCSHELDRATAARAATHRAGALDRVIFHRAPRLPASLKPS